MEKFKKTNLSNVICVRVSDKERDMLWSIAQQKGQKVSQVMRECFSNSICALHNKGSFKYTLEGCHDELRP